MSFLESENKIHGLSSDAKVLYGLMLDQMGLTKKKKLTELFEMG